MTAPDSPERPTLDLDDLPHVHLWKVTSWRSDFGDRYGGTATLTCSRCSFRFEVCPSATASLDLNEARAERDAARAQVAAVLALCDEWETPPADVFPRHLLAKSVRAAVAATSPTPTRPGDDEVTR